MRKINVVVVAFMICLCVFTFSNCLKAIDNKIITKTSKPVVRLDLNIDKGWKFQKGELIGAELTGFDDSGWNKVDVPHDWRIHEERNINNPPNNGFLPKGIGWYRKELDIKPDFRGSRIYVEFDGVFRNCTVWLNGKEAGSHLSGYTGFVLDITDLVDFSSGRNVMAVLVDNLNTAKGRGSAGSEGWWYEGYGIYRHVKLIVTNPIHVSTWGTFVYTEKVSEKSAVVKVKTNITNDTGNPKDLVLNTILIRPNGKRLATISNKCMVDGNSNVEVQQESVVSNPSLWSTDNPNLYKTVTEVYSGDILVDRYETPFGIRWFEFTSDKGFFLNGKYLQLRGMCIHHDYGGLGSALPDRANYQTVEVAKEMGVNIIRSSHNDAAPALMRACDELGILFWAETRYLGSDDNSISSLVDLIHRARNHPSIICWSLANNGGSDDIRYTKMLKVMNDRTHKEDPTRPTAFALEGNGDAWKSGFALVTDIMGYNGGGIGDDDLDHSLYPDRKMLISEFSSGRGARGNYKEIIGSTQTETLGDGRIVTKSGQLTSIYDLCRSHEKEWRHIVERPYLAGGCMWSGIEYGGETNGWPVVTSQFGVLDLCRFRKDAYYYYLQEWTDKPMVHILPHWNWKESDTIDVWCYTNCSEVELLLNGKSLGTKTKVPLGHIEWKVPFQSGVLSAKGLNKGTVAAETKVRTAGVSYLLATSADRKSIKAGGDDLSFITVKVCDKDGTLVPAADNTIEVEVTGGKLLGICSGNPMSHEDPGAGKAKAFNGMLLAVVQSYDRAGKISVKVKSEGLEPDSIVLEAK